MHVVFIGASGAGKTHWGRELARLTGRPFSDLDALVEAALDASILEPFSKGRIAEFRAMEASLLAEALNSDAPAILSTGGGTPLHPDSFKRLQESGAHIVALVPSLELLLARLEAVWKRRPLLASEGPKGWRSKVEKLLDERSPIYAQLAHEVWSGNEGECCEELARKLNESQSK